MSPEYSSLLCCVSLGWPVLPFMVKLPFGSFIKTLSRLVGTILVLCPGCISLRGGTDQSSVTGVIVTGFNLFVISDSTNITHTAVISGSILLKILLAYKNHIKGFLCGFLLIACFVAININKKGSLMMYSHVRPSFIL